MSEYQDAKAKVFEIVENDEQKAYIVADLVVECRRPLTGQEERHHPLAKMTRTIGSELQVVDWQEILRRLENTH